MLRILILCCLLTNASVIYGQKEKPPVENTERPGIPAPVFKDSMDFIYYHPNNPDLEYQVKDTSISDFFQHVDPALDRGFNYLTLGNAGSESRPIKNKSFTEPSYQFGYHGYDLYNYTLDNFKFYRAKIPYSDLAFSPVSGQENFVVRADFARSFNDGMEFSLNYRRINQEGFYLNQNTKITNIGFGIAYLPENSRRKTYLTFISNANDVNNNGGITTDDLFDAPFNDDRMNIPTFLTTANTRHQERIWALSQHYDLISADSSDWQLKLSADLQYSSKYFKFADPNVNQGDTVFYKDLLVDLRGLRTYISYKKTSAAFYIHALNKRLHFKTGISYDRYAIDQSPVNNSINDIHLSFDGRIPIGPKLDLISKGSLGIGSNAGTFEIDGSINLELGSWLHLSPGITFYRQRPSYIHDQLFVSEIEAWNNDFSNYFGSKIYGELSIPKLGLSATLTQSVEDNTIYWGTDFRPVQSSEVYTATSLELAWRIKWGILRFDNYGMLQAFNDNIYHLPELYSKHDLAIQFHLFDRKMLTRFGVESTLIPSYSGVTYQPLVGQFIPSEQEIPFYPLADLYFSAKVQSFRVFIKMENSSSFINQDIYYRIVNQPQFDRKLRFGIRWQIYR